MSKKTRGKTKGNQAQKLRYKAAADKNCVAKLERHVKKFPNDEQAKAALKAGVSPSGGKRRAGKGVLIEVRVDEPAKEVYYEKRHLGRRMGTTEKAAMQLDAEMRRLNNALLVQPKALDKKGNKINNKYISKVNHAAMLGGYVEPLGG